MGTLDQLFQLAWVKHGGRNFSPQTCSTNGWHVPGLRIFTGQDLILRSLYLDPNLLCSVFEDYVPVLKTIKESFQSRKSIPRSRGKGEVLVDAASSWQHRLLGKNIGTFLLLFSPFYQASEICGSPSCPGVKAALFPWFAFSICGLTSC